MTHLLVAGVLHPAGVARLEALRAEGLTVTHVADNSDAAYLPFVGAADALVIRTQPLTAETVARAPRLSVVSRHGVGCDAVDIAALTARAIPLTIVGDVNSVSVAEHAMMLLLAAAKRVLRSDRAVRAPEHWGWRNRLEAREVSRRNLLIIGYGRSGRHLARMAAGFEMNVRAHDPFLGPADWPEGAVARAPDLIPALGWADFVSIHAPKGEKPVLGAGEIAAMKPGAVLANTARGGMLDEAALARALATGQLGAAGIDVFETEPADGTSPLAGLDNVVLSPHIAGLTDEAAERMALASIANALACLDGSIDPDLIVNRVALQG